MLLPRILFFPFHFPPRFLVDVGESSYPSIRGRVRMSAISRSVINGLIFQSVVSIIFHATNSSIYMVNLSVGHEARLRSIVRSLSLEFLSSFACFLVLYIRDKIKTIDNGCRNLQSPFRTPNLPQLPVNLPQKENNLFDRRSPPKMPSRCFLSLNPRSPSNLRGPRQRTALIFRLLRPNRIFPQSRSRKV